MNSQDLRGEIANLHHSGTPGSGLIIIIRKYIHVRILYRYTHTQKQGNSVNIYAAQMHITCASTLLACSVRQFLTCFKQPVTSASGHSSIRCAVDRTKSSVFYPTSSEEVRCSYTMDDGHGHDSSYGFKVLLPAGMYVCRKHFVSFMTLKQSVLLCQFFVKQSKHFVQWATCIDSWLANKSNLQWFGRIKIVPAEDLKSIFDKPGPPDIYPVDVFICILILCCLP